MGSLHSLKRIKDGLSFLSHTASAVLLFFLELRYAGSLAILQPLSVYRRDGWLCIRDAGLPICRKGGNLEILNARNGDDVVVAWLGRSSGAGTGVDRDYV